MSLTIPSDDRRVIVRSFWLTLSVLSALPFLLAAWWLGQPTLISVSLVVPIFVALGLYQDASVLWRIYRAWNHRLVGPFSHVATEVVSRICFFIVATAAAGGRSRMPLHDSNELSRWVARGSLPAAAYGASFASESTPKPGFRSWALEYCRWAAQTGNLWAVALIPSLAVLTLLSRGEDGAAQGNIYTLF